MLEKEVGASLLLAAKTEFEKKNKNSIKFEFATTMGKEINHGLLRVVYRFGISIGAEFDLSTLSEETKNELKANVLPLAKVFSRIAKHAEVSSQSHRYLDVQSGIQVAMTKNKAIKDSLLVRILTVYPRMEESARLAWEKSSNGRPVIQIN